MLRLSGSVDGEHSTITLKYDEEGKPALLSLQTGDAYFTFFYVGSDESLSIFRERESNDDEWMYIGLELDKMSETVEGGIEWKRKGKKKQYRNFTLLVD